MTDIVSDSHTRTHPPTKSEKIFKIAHLEKLVPFTELYRLLPAVVAFVEISRYTAELDELVLFKPLGQRDVVKIIKSVDRRTEAIVVFLFNKQIIQSFVYGLVVVTLNRS